MFQDSTQVVLESVTALKAEVFQRLDTLAAELSTTAAELWDILLYKHFWIAGVYDLVLGIIFITVAIVAALSLKRNIRLAIEDSKEHNGYWQEWPTTWVVVSVIFTIVFAIVGPLTLFASIPHLLSPEYYALQEILKTVF